MLRRERAHRALTKPSKRAPFYISLVFRLHLDVASLICIVQLDSGPTRTLTRNPRRCLIHPISHITHFMSIIGSTELIPPLRPSSGYIL